MPIWFPEDTEIDEPEIAAVDRPMAFASETQYMLRETEEGDAPCLSQIVHGYLALTLLAWFLAFAATVRPIGGAGVPTEVAPRDRTPQPA